MTTKDSGTATKLIKQMKSPTAKKGIAAEFQTAIAQHVPTFPLGRSADGEIVFQNGHLRVVCVCLSVGAGLLNDFCFGDGNRRLEFRLLVHYT